MTSNSWLPISCTQCASRHRAPSARPGNARAKAFYGEDLEALIPQIEAAGGTIVKPIFPFPGGRRFHFTDPEGYELAMWTEG